MSPWRASVISPVQQNAQTIQVIDSHTAGEPTRLVVSGGPGLGGGSLADRFRRLRAEQDAWRRAILCEPRGSDVLVGAWLLAPDDCNCVAAVIFFNNAGYLGMCGHGMIGVAATLAYLGRIAAGTHRIQTPVGVVSVRLETANRITIRNVPAYRYLAGVSIEVKGFGQITGDVAWGGNWFFLTGGHGFALDMKSVDELTAFTWEIRLALAAAGITGKDGAEIDHIELFTTAHDPAQDSRNFVLCPGKAYDRSPCGTGTSAKMACLVADGRLQPGQAWRQEGILGTLFEGSVEFKDGEIHPSITGSAFVTGEATLVFDANDPFRMGIPA